MEYCIVIAHWLIRILIDICVWHKDCTTNLVQLFDLKSVWWSERGSAVIRTRLRVRTDIRTDRRLMIALTTMCNISHNSMQWHDIVFISISFQIFMASVNPDEQRLVHLTSPIGSRPVGRKSIGQCIITFQLQEEWNPYQHTG